LSDYLAAVILGIVEGLTEFLPVSSTGHLILVQPLLDVDPEQPTWRVFLFVSQLGAILAVVAYFWRDLWRRVLAKPLGGLGSHIVVKLVAAMIPTVALGLLLNDLMEEHFESGAYAPAYVAGALIVGAGLILWIDRRFRRPGEMTLEDITLRQAIAIGLFQCLAMWPGTSRAGATIMGGMVLGLTPKVATEFSFYLAIPTMFAAGGYRLLKYHRDLTGDGLGIVLLGTAVSFVVALAVVAWFMSYVRSKRFTPFAVYRVVLGVAVLGWGANR
jgi:undecaprenyl-diphosphatase